MANDSPAKSLVDIDLSSLRVSIGRGGLQGLPTRSCVLSGWSNICLLQTKANTVVCIFEQVYEQCICHYFDEESATAAELWAFLCLQCIGMCMRWEQQLRLTLSLPSISSHLLSNLLHFSDLIWNISVNLNISLFAGPCRDFWIGGSSRKWNLWTSIQGWFLLAKFLCFPVLYYVPHDMCWKHKRFLGFHHAPFGSAI